jgi:hypothetical protein
MDLIEEYANLDGIDPPISNTEIYKLQEFYSDIRYVPPETIYRAFPIKETSVKKKTIHEIFKLTIICVPYFIIKVEYN